MIIHTLQAGDQLAFLSEKVGIFLDDDHVRVDDLLLGLQDLGGLLLELEVLVLGLWVLSQVPVHPHGLLHVVQVLGNFLRSVLIIRLLSAILEVLLLLALARLSWLARLLQHRLLGLGLRLSWLGIMRILDPSHRDVGLDWVHGQRAPLGHRPPRVPGWWWDDWLLGRLWGLLLADLDWVAPALLTFFLLDFLVNLSKLLLLVVGLSTWRQGLPRWPRRCWQLA